MTNHEWRKFYEELRTIGIDVDKLKREIHLAKMRYNRAKNLEAARERDREYYNKHRSERADSMHRYNMQNKDKNTERHRKYYQEHKEEIEAWRRDWAKTKRREARKQKEEEE